MSTNLDKLFEENIRNNLKQKNYSECISLLNMKIKDLLEHKIQKKNKFFKSKSLDLMLEEGPKVLDEKDLNSLLNFYTVTRLTGDKEIKISKLLAIYKNLK